MKYLHKIMSAILVCALTLSMCAAAVVNTSAAVAGKVVDYYVKKGEIVTYEVDITADEPFENIQAYVEYDPDVLEVITHKYNSETDKEFKIPTKTMFPELSGIVYNTGDKGYVKFNASMLDRFDFTRGGKVLSIDFYAKASAKTDIQLNIVYMTIDAGENHAYFAEGKQIITKGIEVNETAFAAAFTPVVTLSENSYEYDGIAKTPEVKVTYGELLLKEGTDYTVKYTDNTEAGTAKAVVSGIGKYSGVVDCIKTFDILGGFVVDGKKFEAKAGDKITYTVDVAANEAFENVQARVKFNPDVLTLVKRKYNAATNTEYELKAADLTPNLTGVVMNTKDAGFFKFNASNIDRFDFKGGKNLITLEFIVKNSAGCAITLEMQEMNIDAEVNRSYYTDGKAYVTKGITITEGATVTAFAPEVTLSQNSFAYDGKAKTPEVRVVFDDILLHEGEDYVVTYSNNVNAGTAKAVVSYKGRFANVGDSVKTFLITRGFNVGGKQFKAQRGDKITYTVDVAANEAFENVQSRVCYDADVLELVNTKYDSKTNTEYELKATDRTPNLTGVVMNTKDAGFVKFNASNIDRFDFKGGKNLITLEFVVKNSAGCAITLEMQEMNIDAEVNRSYYTDGKASVTKGITITEDATVTPFAPEITLESGVMIYDGKAKTPEVKVVFADMLLHEGEDYGVAYSNNVNAGTAQAKVFFLGNYEGDYVKEFRIINGYIDPETNIIIDNTYGYSPEIKTVEKDKFAANADFYLKGMSFTSLYEVNLADKNGNDVNREFVVRIPCHSKDAELYSIYVNPVTNEKILTKLVSVDYTDGYLVFETYDIHMFIVAEPTEPCKVGDANGDNVVNVKDVTIIQKFIASIETAELTGVEFADTNGDGSVNIKDATAIQRYIADIETGYDIGNIYE